MKSACGGAIAGENVYVPTTLPSREEEHTLKLEHQVSLLFDELREPVYRYLLCLRMRPSQAEEIIQETFLRLYTHLHAGGKPENVRGWVFRVAHNISINELKRQKCITGMSPEFWASFSGSIADLAPTPEETLLCKERMVRVHAAISMLSGQQKQCVFLRAEGLRYREIAEVLGVSLSTVTESLRRAIKKLARGCYE